MKITILDSYASCPTGGDWKKLEQYGELTVWDNTRPEDIVSRAALCEAVLTNKVVISREIMAQLPRLRYVGVLATGYNVVDTAAARERGIVVTNIPAYSTESVVQMVFAHLLNVTNRVAHYAETAQKGKWAMSPHFCYLDFQHHELHGKTIGIVGLGNIGGRVAEVAHAFGLRVIAVTSKRGEALPPYVTPTDADALFREADIITLHCPLTPTTRNLVSAARLATLRPGAIIINTGRGPLIDDNAVAAALKAGRLAAYCADVMTVEPPSADNPLLSAPNCFLTPHIAWATEEARTRLQDTAIRNLAAFAEGKPINIVS